MIAENSDIPDYDFGVDPSVVETIEVGGEQITWVRATRRRSGSGQEEQESEAGLAHIETSDPAWALADRGLHLYHRTVAPGDPSIQRSGRQP